MSSKDMRRFKLRAGGTKTFLIDASDPRFIYKGISSYETREIDFYRDLTDSCSRSDENNSSNTLMGLVRQGIISKFHGIEHSNGKEFIKLTNFVHGMERPIILDIKIGDVPVGSSIGEPGYETIRELFSKTTQRQREKALHIYQECKRNGKHGELTFQALKLPISSTNSTKEFHITMKHLAQKHRIEKSPTSDLGFRIAGSNLTSKKELKKLNTLETVEYIFKTFLGVDDCKTTKIARAQSLLRQIVPISDYFRCHCRHRFYSSSILLIYDAKSNKDNTYVHWVDFVHVYEDQDSSTLMDNHKPTALLIRKEGCDKACLRAVEHLKDILLHITADLPYTIPQRLSVTSSSPLSSPRSPPSDRHGVFDFTNSPKRRVSPRSHQRLMSSRFKQKDQQQYNKDHVLRMVVAVHRHGARFPKKCRKEDLCWPQDSQFYDSYSANLTIHGTFQAYDLGRRFRQRYILRQNLFRNIAPIEISDCVRVHTSNLHRTLFTASALLRGMFPNIPHFFNYYTDRLDVNLDNIEANLRKGSQTLGIGIQVESQVTNDELFHQIKTATEHAKEFKEKNVLSCEFMKQIQSNEEEWKALADKLFIMTEEDVFDPSKNTLIERIAKFKVVANQIRIARAHNMPSFPNRKCLHLSAKEESMVFEAARNYWKYMFRPANSNLVKDGIGNESASHLAGVIASRLNEVILGISKLRFMDFSAHDTTLLALASLLGIDIDAPDFTGNFTFELYRKRSRLELPSPWEILVGYDPSPHTIPSQNRFMKLPLDGKYHYWKDLEEGYINAAELLSYMADHGQLLSSYLLRSLDKWSGHVNTGKMKWSDLLEMGESIASEKKFHDVFDYYDIDHSDRIEVKELQSAFRELGLTKISQASIKKLVSFVKKSINKDHQEEDDNVLNFACFRSLMSLVVKPEASRQWIERRVQHGIYKDG